MSVNEFVGRYRTGGAMHARPTVRFIRSAMEIMKGHAGIELFARNAEGPGSDLNPIECTSYMGLTAHCFGYKTGLEVEITARGPYDTKTLRSAADLLAQQVIGPTEEAWRPRPRSDQSS